MAAPEAGPLRMLLTLGLAGMCSGLALVGIYSLTKPMIDRNQAKALEAAIFEVLQGTTERVAYVVREGVLERFESQDGSLPKEEAIYAGYDEAGEFVGFAIPAEGPGFQDIIKLIYGYDPARERVVGMKVLDNRETPGLGDKIVKDDAFVNCFRDLAVSPDVVAVKTGRTQDHEVDAITGATISSVAVVRIINEANARWLERLPEPDAAPAAGEAGAGGSGE